jgi:FAD/FMN-containing dehydrogenase
MLCGLARDCRMLGGRVHLVKSVVADPEDLRAMYGEAAAKLKVLKQKYDPNGLLRNDFFDRVFDA